MGSDHEQLLGILKLPDSAVRAAFRVGSRVYGTAGPGSDNDYLVVLEKPDQKQDLLFGRDVNVIVHGLRSFQSALDDGSVLAFEAVFAPPPHRLKEPRPPFAFKLDRARLVESAIGRSTSDFEKARKRFSEEVEPSKKKLYHALRVLLFARELAQTGKLETLGAANDYFEDILSDPSEDFAHYEARYGGVRAALCEELRALAGRR